MPYRSDTAPDSARRRSEVPADSISAARGLREVAVASRRPSESAMALAAASPGRKASARPLRLAESPGLSDLLLIPPPPLFLEHFIKLI